MGLGAPKPCGAALRLRAPSAVAGLPPSPRSPIEQATARAGDSGESGAYPRAMQASTRSGTLVLAALVSGFVGANLTVGCFAFEVCDDLPDEAPEASAVDFVVQNDRAVRVFVEFSDSDCDKVEGFTLTGAGASLNWRRPPCGLSCDAVRSGPCDCNESCGGPTVLRLEPGASYSIAWDGSSYLEHEVSVDCAEEGCPLTCFQRTPAPEGVSYGLSVLASLSCDGDCECAAGQDACIVPGTLEGTTFEARTDFTGPASDAVDVVLR